MTGFDSVAHALARGPHGDAVLMQGCMWLLPRPTDQVKACSEHPDVPVSPP